MHACMHVPGPPEAPVFEESFSVQIDTFDSVPSISSTNTTQKRSLARSKSDLSHEEIGCTHSLDRCLAGGRTDIVEVLGSGGRFTHLFDEVDSGLQVETEIDEFPLDALPLVLLLLKDEHL